MPLPFGVNLGNLQAALRITGGDRYAAEDLLRRQQGEPTPPTPPEQPPVPEIASPEPAHPRVFGKTRDLAENPYGVDAPASYDAATMDRARKYLDRSGSASGSAGLSASPAQGVSADQISRVNAALSPSYDVPSVDAGSSIRELRRQQLEGGNAQMRGEVALGDMRAAEGQARAALSTQTADEQRSERLLNAQRNADSLLRTDPIRTDQYDTVRQLQDLVRDKPGEDSPRLRKAGEIMSMIPGAHLFGRPMVALADARDERNRQDWVDRQNAARGLIEAESGLISNENASAESEGRATHQRAILANVENLNRLEAESASAGSEQERLKAALGALKVRNQIAESLIGQKTTDAKAAAGQRRSLQDAALLSQLANAPEDARAQLAAQYGERGLAMLGKLNDRVMDQADIDGKRATSFNALADAEKKHRDGLGDAPGADVVGGYRVKNAAIWGSLPPAVKTDFAKAQGQLPGLIEDMKKLQALVQEHGTETLPGEVKSQMAALQGSITDGIKEVAGLGAYDNGVRDLVLGQIGDATAWNAGLGNAVEHADVKLEQAMNSIIRGARAKAVSYGLESGFKGGGGGGGDAAPPSRPAAGATGVELVNLETGEKKVVAPGLVEAYAQYGFVPNRVPDERKPQAAAPAAPQSPTWPGFGG